MTLKEVLQKFEKLSEEKKRFLSSPVVLAYVEELESKYNIKLALVLMEIVANEEKEESIDLLDAKLHLEKDKAKNLLDDIKEKILNEFYQIGKVKKEIKQEVNRPRPIETAKVNFIPPKNLPVVNKEIVEPREDRPTLSNEQIEINRVRDEIKKNHVLAPPSPVTIVPKNNFITAATSRPIEKKAFEVKPVESQRFTFNNNDKGFEKVQAQTQLKAPITNSVDWNKEADVIIKNLNINIGGDLNIKLKNVLSSTLRGVRSTIDSRVILNKRPEDGGLGLESSLIDNILGAIKHRRKMIEDIHSGVKLPSHIFVLSGDGEPMIKKEKREVDLKSTAISPSSPIFKQFTPAQPIRQISVGQEKIKQAPVFNQPLVQNNKEDNRLENVSAKDRETSGIKKENTSSSKKKKWFSFFFSKKHKPVAAPSQNLGTSNIVVGQKSEDKPVSQVESVSPILTKKAISNNVDKKILTPPPITIPSQNKVDHDNLKELEVKKELDKAAEEEKKKMVEKNKKEMEEILNKTIEKVLDKNASSQPTKQTFGRQEGVVLAKKEPVQNIVPNQQVVSNNDEEEVSQEKKINNFREKAPLISSNNTLQNKSQLTSSLKTFPSPIKKEGDPLIKDDNQEKQNQKQIDKTTKEIKKGLFFGLFNKKKKDKKITSKKVKIEDVKRVDMTAYEGDDRHKLIGPIEELEGLTLSDFRNLSNDPVIAIGKIEEKIKNLEIESLSKRILGIKAWKKCEINQAYLSILNEAMMKNISFEAVITERNRARIPVIDIKEFEAIAGLSKKLRF